MKENLMFAHFGNGMSVCDRNREEHGDYMSVAHISVMREVTYRKHPLSNEAKQEIERFSETYDGNISATQEQKIFHIRKKGNLLYAAKIENLNNGDSFTKHWIEFDKDEAKNQLMKDATEHVPFHFRVGKEPQKWVFKTIVQMT